MTETAQGESVPKRLLLATDLSARCDRALDRAAQLAEAWQAEIVAVNVLDLGSTPDQILAWASGATDQDLRQIALQAIEQTHFYPENGKARHGQCKAEKYRPNR